MQKRSLQSLLLALILALALLVWLDAPTWLLFALLLILLGLVGGMMGQERPSPPPEPPRQAYPPEEFFVQEQIIVRGPRAEVETAVRAAGNPARLERLDFAGLDQRLRDCLAGCEDFDFADFVIDLYHLSGSDRDIAAAIRAIEGAVGRGSSVRAEPNWLSGHPWDPTGSPWEPTGSPWDPTGSGSGGNQAQAAHFLTQWAFKEIGLAAGDSRATGRGVRLGLFDTSPFADREVSGGNGRSIPWVTEPAPLTLALVHYETPPATEERDLSSHGLFAAGIAHAVAPAADIQLIRVLNANNQGTMFSLNRALFDFIRANGVAAGQMGVVINLSLGIRLPPGEAGFDLPLEVQSLRDLLRLADCAGMVVVAAAGNDSANLPQPEPAHLPANWPTIIGVAGSTQERERAAFSNRGELAAPAGNGRYDQTTGKFLPANDACTAGDCPYALIGPVRQTEGNSGFAYWSGTSFAAPMVAGLAALVIERGGGRLSPKEVRRIIECGLTPVEDGALGKGIIHVTHTLDNFERCAAEYGIQLEPPRQTSA